MTRFDGEFLAFAKYILWRWRYIQCLDHCNKGKKVEEYLETAEALNRLPELDLNTAVYNNHISDLSQPCAFKQLFMLITLWFTAVTRNIKQHFRESGTAAHYAVSIDWIIIQHMEIRRTIVYQCQLEFLRAEDLINLFFLYVSNRQSTFNFRKVNIKKEKTLIFEEMACCCSSGILTISGKMYGTGPQRWRAGGRCDILWWRTIRQTNIRTVGWPMSAASVWKSTSGLTRSSTNG